LFPNIQLWLDQTWGFGPEIVARISAASNVVVGSNPAYTAADFFTFYPKYARTPQVYSGATTVNGSPTVLLPTSPGFPTIVAPGQWITGDGIPYSPNSMPVGGTFVKLVDSTGQITLTQNATVSSTSAQVQIYSIPLLPMAVVNAYVALASSHLVQARWQDTWTIAMGYFIAHFATLWLKSDGVRSSVPGVAASSGLARGIVVAKSAGPASMNFERTPGLDEWAAWNETDYGKQLATLAKCFGAGPMFLW